MNASIIVDSKSFGPTKRSQCTAKDEEQPINNDPWMLPWTGPYIYLTTIIFLPRQDPVKIVSCRRYLYQ